MVRHRPGHVIVLSQLVFVAKLPMTPEIYRRRVDLAGRPPHVYAKPYAYHGICFVTHYTPVCSTQPVLFV